MCRWAVHDGVVLADWLINACVFWLQGLDGGGGGGGGGGVAGGGGGGGGVGGETVLPQLHEPRIDSYRFSMANLEGT